MNQSNIIDGKAVSLELLNKLSDEIKILYQELKIQPKLVIILANNDEASRLYVNNKIKVGTNLGINVELIHCSCDISEINLINTIHDLNNDQTVHGIIVQLPLSIHINIQNITNAISPSKDVDGFHVQNIGKVAYNYKTLFSPCTPLGCLYLLKKYLNNDLTGKHAVIIGRSQIVGRPLALLLINNNCTVTLCHSHTKDLKYHTNAADILIAAIGCPYFFDASYVKIGAVVIDVGITFSGGKIKGDVNFEEVIKKARYITPVPGGVGPMTVAYLMHNTVKAAKNSVIT